MASSDPENKPDDDEVSSTERRKKEFALHRAVFANDIKAVALILRNTPGVVAQKDLHGNTPLHLAIMMGHKECASLLLAHNAPVKVKNVQGWTPLAEAASFGDRPTISAVLRKLKQQSRESIHGRKAHLIQVLKSLGNFYLELHWDFHSWIPFLSSMLPSDTCKIYKKGANIRMDTTLVDFTETSWERGDVSFIFNAEAPPGLSLVILDHKARIYQKVRAEGSDTEIEQEVDVIMSSDIINAQVSTKTINFKRARTGWLFRQERTELIGDYTAEFFTVEGMNLDCKKRREHLSAEDVKKNKAIIDNFRLGSLSHDEEWRRLQTLVRRKSLPKPPRSTVTWEDYVSSSIPGKHPCLGRAMIVKDTVRLLKATVAMSQEFPLTIETLLDVLEIIAPFKHLNKLRLFCKLRLPPGFPVKIELPLLPTVSATVTFKKFEYRRDILDSMFNIPNSYCEESDHFPDL